MKKYIVLILSMFFIFSLSSCGKEEVETKTDDASQTEEQKELVIFCELSGTMQLEDDQGNLQGSTVEMVRAIQGKIGNTTEIQVVPWARGYNAILNYPNVILFSTTRTAEREELGFHWVGPVLRASWVLYAKKGSAISLSNLEDAKKVGQIGTYTDDVREKFLKGEGFTNLRSGTNNVENVRMLMGDRLDLVISTDIGMPQTMEDAGFSIDDVESKLVIREVDLYIAFSKDTDPEIIKQWDDAFAAIHREGTFNKIYNTYYPSLTPPQRVPAR